jgi:hypothetical protein
MGPPKEGAEQGNGGEKRLSFTSNLLAWFGFGPDGSQVYETPDRDLVQLIGQLDQARIADLGRLYSRNAYYEGRQPLRFMTEVIARRFGDRLTPLILDWPRLGVDAYEHRLDVEGFRYGGGESSDESLWQVWQANDLDEQSQQAHLDSLALGRSYVLVGAGDSSDDPPMVTVESPFQVSALRDPRTLKITALMKRWAESDGSQWAAVYRPDDTVIATLDRSNWRIVHRDDHQVGRVLAAVLPNRPRLLHPDGMSEFEDLIPIADAANKIATDMMTSAENYIMPRRWIFGLKEEDFKDEAGNDIPTFDLLAGNIWTSENENAKAGQFPEADLANFHNTIKLLAQMAAQTLALPPYYMGFVGENPTSADAIRSSEVQLVKRVNRKQTYLGGAWEDVMRMVLRVQSGSWDQAARSMETQWRDPATPTDAQKADAVVKKVQAGIIPVEQAREDLGYSPEQRRRMAAMDQDAATDPTIEALTGKLLAGAGDATS